MRAADIHVIYFYNDKHARFLSYTTVNAPRSKLTGLYSVEERRPILSKSLFPIIVLHSTQICLVYAFTDSYLYSVNYKLLQKVAGTCNLQSVICNLHVIRSSETCRTTYTNAVLQARLGLLMDNCQSLKSYPFHDHLIAIFFKFIF